MNSDPTVLQKRFVERERAVAGLGVLEQIAARDLVDMGSGLIQMGE